MPATSEPPVTRERIRAVEPILRPWLRRTPILALDGREIGLRPFALTLKLELLQHAGSFKEFSGTRKGRVRSVEPTTPMSTSMKKGAMTVRSASPGNGPGRGLMT